MIEHLLIEYSHIPERRNELQSKVNDVIQRKRDAEEMIYTAARTSQTKYYADHMGDMVSKIIDEYEKHAEFYFSQIRNCNEKERKVLAALEKLDYPKYQIIVLRYMKRMKWEDIARQMNYSRRQCINIKDAALMELKKYCES